jgi:hypothetical protein
MTPFLYNLLVFLPLLLLAGGALYLLERYGQQSPPSPPPPPPPPEDDALHYEDEVPTTAELDDLTHESVEDSDEGEGEGEDGDLLLPAEHGDLLQDDQPAEHGDDDQPAAAGTPPIARATRARVVGTKKARSLARRDQRRAYHEFLHSQAAARAEAEAALREEAEARAFENARRRYLLEEEVAAKREKERVEREERERREREREGRDVDVVVKALRKGGVVRLQALAEKVGRGREWVEAVVRREGFLGTGEDGSVRFVTREGVWVCFEMEMQRRLWEVLQERGRMEWSEIGAVMEGLLVGEA